MEIKITTKQILRFLSLLAWLIFIGLCIEAGSFIFNAIYTFTLKQNNSTYLGLEELFRADQGNYLVVIAFMTVAAIMKALIFYFIIKNLPENKLNLAKPFNWETGRLVSNIASLSFGIGIFSLWGSKYTSWLIEKGMTLPSTEHLRLAGGDVWIFMGIILYVIAQIFKRGIEMQNENDLTI